MTNTDVINIILDMVREYFVYMIPVIGVLAGIVFVVSFFMSVVFGAGRRTFGG